MESFEGHLGGRFSYTLSSQCTYRLSWLYNTSINFLDVDAKKEFELQISDPIKNILQVNLMIFSLTLYLLIIFF